VTRAITLAGYVVIAAAIGVSELRARRGGTATIGDALTLLMRRRVGRGIVLAGWLWLGWHLFVRVGGR
jgi:Family of unknown function (DUF6186)